MDEVLCSIGTRGRYDTTLPLALAAIINQTKRPDKVVIFDDNDTPRDVRNELIYRNLFQMMDIKGIKWEWLYAAKKGTHHNHQAANIMGYKWVWRMDDDAIPESDVLRTLLSFAIFSNAGAVGGSILTPPLNFENSNPTGYIENIATEPNPQWRIITRRQQVEHLHCSFLYRAGVHDYNLGLSRVAHREETLFTYGLHKKGFGIFIVPDAITWHLKNPSGGIRSETDTSMYSHDEQIFQNFLAFKNNTIVVLNCGLGDHLVFKKVLPDIKNPMIFSCYPEVIPGESIAAAQNLFGNIDQWNIYLKMAQWKWNQPLEAAFRKMYL